VWPLVLSDSPTATHEITTKEGKVPDAASVI